MLAGLSSTARWWSPPLCSPTPSQLPLSTDHWETRPLQSREEQLGWFILWCRSEVRPTSVWYSSSLVKFRQQEKTRIARQRIQEALCDSRYWGLEWWGVDPTFLHHHNISFTSSRPTVSPPPHQELSKLTLSATFEWSRAARALSGATPQQLTTRRPDRRLDLRPDLRPD